MGDQVRSWLMASVVLSLLMTTLCTASYVSQTTTGYQDVVVVIEENTDLSDCTVALELVKEMIRSTSTNFTKALIDHPSHFDNVTIIVPDSWIDNRTCMSLITTNTWWLDGTPPAFPWARTHRADIRITPDNVVFRSFPYSLQYGGCQEPGLAINVPSTIYSSTTESIGMRMAREWAHYRYGVFDEGGLPNDERHPAAYMSYATGRSDKIVKTNTCSNKVTPNGKWNENGCSSSAGPECEFEPNLDNPQVHSSVMYRPDLHQMESFCTNENHDDGVPSKHNYHCNGKSVMQVITDHPDFSREFGNIDSSAEITFNVIKNPFNGYHLVIDTSSASYASDTTFNIVKQSVLNFVYYLPNGVWLSIDTFDSVRKELQSLVYLDDDTISGVIGNLFSNLKKVTSNNVNGLVTALNQAQTNALNGLDVILLTPATSTPDINDQIKSFKTNKVNVHLVYLGVPQVSVDLAKLCWYGSVQFIPLVTSADNLHSGYSWTINALQSIFSQTKTRRSKILERPIIKSNAASSLIHNGTFYLDSPASRILLSLYQLNADNPVSVNNFILTSPSNNGPITIDDQQLDIGSYFYLANLVAPSTNDGTLLPFDKGLWQYNFLLDRTSTINGTLKLDIWAEASDGSMIQLKSWNTAAVDNSEVDLSQQPVGLYAQLTAFNGRPVLGAQVVAHVYTNDRLVAEVQLTDSDVADVTTGDGIYSGYFAPDSSSSAPLVYSVRYEASAVNGEAVVDSQPYDRPPTTGSYIQVTQPMTVADEFNRFSYGPSFRLLAGSLNGDRIPPMRITDLIIVSYDSSNGKAVLSWTAPMDNYGTGEVISQFRVTQSIGSESPSQIFGGFIQSELNETIIYSIDKVPTVPTGSYVKYHVVGVDGSSNVAYPSNIVSLSGPPADTGLSATALGLIIGFSILLFIIIVIVLFCWLCPDKARRNKRKAKRTVKRIFSTSDNKTHSTKETNKKKKEEEDVVAEWQSPAIATTLDRQPGVILQDQLKRQSNQSLNAPERIYFGQEDIDQMVAKAADTKSDDWSESQRGYDEVIKRAPSMDLQLAAILLKNSSNLTVDKVGLDDEPLAMIRNQKGKSLDTINETTIRNPNIYSPPVRPSTKSAPYGSSSSRPVSQSQSETNLYYTDARLNKVKNNQSSRSSPTNSYLSVHAEQRVDVIPGGTLQSNGANWQDSNSFIYTDPRFDGGRPNSFVSDAASHPVNQVGLPLGPPPPVPRATSQSSLSYIQQQQDYANTLILDDDNQLSTGQTAVINRSGSKPSLVSAV